MSVPLKEIADALGVKPQYISVLKRRGMPVSTVDAARDWYLAQGDKRSRPAPIAAPQSLDDGTLADGIAAHKALVSQARGVWQAAMDQGDSNQGKFQTAYNQSYKTLLDLEAEQERRLKESRTFILRAEAEASMKQLMAEVVNRLDKLALDVAEQCNPANPPIAVKALEAWVRRTREALCSDETEA